MVWKSFDNKDVDLKDYDLEQWRLMHIGAQPVPPSLIRHWKEYFPNHKYDTNYGLSESIGPGCVHLGLDHIDKVGAIGKAGRQRLSMRMEIWSHRAKLESWQSKVRES